MKRVLITGGAGFIAHHLIGYLIKNTNWEIISLDRLDYSGNLNRLDHIMSQFSENDRKRVKIIYHDLKAELNPWIASDIGHVNYILHLAAGSHVDRSIKFPMEFVMDNVVGTCNILNFAFIFYEDLINVSIQAKNHISEVKDEQIMSICKFEVKLTKCLNSP